MVPRLRGWARWSMASFRRRGFVLRPALAAASDAPSSLAAAAGDGTLRPPPRVPLRRGRLLLQLVIPRIARSDLALPYRHRRFRAEAAMHRDVKVRIDFLHAQRNSILLAGTASRGASAPRAAPEVLALGRRWVVS